MVPIIDPKKWLNKKSPENGQFQKWKVDYSTKEIQKVKGYH